MTLKEIYQLIDSSFNAVDQSIRTQLASRVPLVEEIAEYITEAGGKRLRPVVTLLAGHCLNKDDSDLVNLAAIIEFLHTATLLHDDVVDRSDLRRGRDTANRKFGNAASVLVGDFLYSRAFEMMTDLGNLDVMRILSRGTNIIAEGEVLQLLNVRNPNVTEDEYYQVIEGKTAQLFASATESAAALSGADSTQREALRNYGLHLGMAFQIQDDLLDYLGKVEDIGKSIGDDLAEGKPTLPIIFCLQSLEQKAQNRLRQIILNGEREALDEVVDLVRQTDALEKTKVIAERFCEQAIESLACLPTSEYKDALASLAEIAIHREK